MRAPALIREPPGVADARLARLKVSPDCALHYEGVQFGAKRDLKLSVYGAYPTREIFLEVTDGQHVRVNSFLSRLENFPAELRQTELPLVDISDAFQLARTMTKEWPRYSEPKALPG